MKILNDTKLLRELDTLRNEYDSAYLNLKRNITMKAPWARFAAGRAAVFIFGHPLRILCFCISTRLDTAARLRKRWR